MEKILTLMKDKSRVIKEKFFTKHEKQPSEQYNKIIYILNR